MNSSTRNPAQMPLRLPSSLHVDLKRAAEEEGVSLNQYCLYLLSRHLTPASGASQKKLEELFHFLEEARDLQKEFDKTKKMIPQVNPKQSPLQRWRELYGKA